VRRGLRRISRVATGRQSDWYQPSIGVVTRPWERLRANSGGDLEAWQGVGNPPRRHLVALGIGAPAGLLATAATYCSSQPITVRFAQRAAAHCTTCPSPPPPRRVPVEGTPETIVVRPAVQTDVVACKRIADAHRGVFGFLTRGLFREAVERDKLLVAEDSSGAVVGFVRFNHRRRGDETVLYDIASDPGGGQPGIGRALVGALAASAREAGRNSIVLRCPEGVPANGFYQALGFRQQGIEQGRRRRLVAWRLPLEAAAASLSP